MDELLTDSEGWDKGLSAFEEYLDECLDFPFAARFRDKKYGNPKTAFHVLRLTCCRNRGGIFCEIQFENNAKRELPIYCIKTSDPKHKRNVALNDYIWWLPFKA